MKGHAPADLQPDFYRSIAEVLRATRTKAYRAVNFAMVEAYWHIGRMIVEEEQQGRERADYGTALIRSLSVRLTEEFGKGFDERELRRIRQFYLSFSIRGALRPNWRGPITDCSSGWKRLLHAPGTCAKPPTRIGVPVPCSGRSIASTTN